MCGAAACSQKEKKDLGKHIKMFNHFTTPFLTKATLMLSPRN